MIFNYKGGIRLFDNKLAKKSKIEELPVPNRLFLSLRQHIGPDMVPLVKEGDYIDQFDKIAKAESFCTAFLHSPYSGVVKTITDHPYVGGGTIKTIIIEKDKTKPEKIPQKLSDDEINQLTPENILEKIKDAGIVGLGGAMFPTYFKLTPQKDKKIDTIIINGAECEPYITADHRLMLEYPLEILKGLCLIQKIFPVTALIGIEKNKIDAFKILNDVMHKEHLINIMLECVPTKYPQGGEKNLIKTLLNRKVPPGKLPLDVGVVMQNVATCKAIYDAVYLNKPLVERTITVTGDYDYQRTFLAKIGTPIDFFLDYANKSSKTNIQPQQILIGGPMMGFSQSTSKVPIIKGNNCIIFKKRVIELQESECINCSRCVDACPMNLMPNMIVKASKALKHDLAQEYKLNDCYECGCCAYVCPSKINHIKWIRMSKKILKARNKPK